jgi:hypothetical protein
MVFYKILKKLKKKNFNFDRSTLNNRAISSLDWKSFFFCHCFAGLHNSTMYLKETILCTQNNHQYKTGDCS